MTDQEVQHLGRDHPGVEYRRALLCEPVAQAGGHLGGLQAHVASEPDAQLGGRLAAQVGQHAREGAPEQVGDPAVHLLAVDAPNVVCLEDRRIDHRPAPPALPRPELSGPAAVRSKRSLSAA